MSTPDDANPPPLIAFPPPPDGNNEDSSSSESETQEVPARPETPALQWSDQRISDRFFDDFTRVEFDTILNNGPAGLWDVLNQSGWMNCWDMYSDACSKFFPNWTPMTHQQARKLAKANYLAQLQAKRAPRTMTPPSFSPYGREDPRTPRGPRPSRPSSLSPVPGPSAQGQDPDVQMGSAPAADPSPDDPFIEDPVAKAESMVQRINGLIWTLNRMIAALPLEKRDGIWNSVQGPRAPGKLAESSTANPLLARTPPMPPQRNRSKRGRSKATKPLIARLSSPHAEAGPSITSFANVAKRTPEQLLTQAKAIVKTAPDTSIHEAMKIAESLPIALPRKNAPSLATVQGTKTSMTITSTEVLIPGRITRVLVDAAGLDPVLSQLRSRLVTLSVDGYCAVLRSNVSITDEQRHAWRALVARTLNVALDTTAIRDRATHSTAKIEFLPKLTSVTPEAITRPSSPSPSMW
ncbi:hypothetical protein M378DRAFT_18831 [Amanita muscaria Koide BX008]|uniref:Uncharacterized protein n=1 Tax=Amanita muscaria (strain Koide BX008) TaxID=946122 RepID=A0A0C2RWA1_AMAMK|nr:hypothetical protein M378DRAFT_18831 [Amanita muscaria Koide BX008]